MDNSENIKISDDKVERLSMAVSELRNAGISNGVIRTYLQIRAAGPLATLEEQEKIIRIFDKYGIDDIKEEDFFAHNQRQSDEMIELILQLTRDSEQKFETYRDFPEESVARLDDTPQMQQEEHQGSSSKVEISQEKIDKLRMAIQEARQKGMDAETIKNYIYPYATVTNFNWEDYKKWGEISTKYGISEIMGEDYMSLDKDYRGNSTEICDIIDGLTQGETRDSEQKFGTYRDFPEESVAQLDDTPQMQQEKVVSLTELGEKSYQHFGRRIAEKLRQTVNALKSRFFSKDKDKIDDLTNER